MFSVVEQNTVSEPVLSDNIEDNYGSRSMRWYQIAARNEAAAAVANGHKRILIVIPTGGGKTLTIASTMSFPAMRKALGVLDDRKLRVLFVAHKHRLLTQAESTFAADSNVDLMLQSMFSPIPQEVISKGWDVCVFDEAQHESASTFQYHLTKLGDKVIIGLTATPDRADGSLIKFDKIINPISRQQAVEQGFLAQTDIFTIVDTPAIDKTDILTDVFNNYADKMGQTMVFVRTKKEVAAIAQALNDAGRPAIGLTNQSEKQLDKILNDFSAKTIQFVVNCSKISEGVDVKGCETVVLGRTIGSYPLLNQIVGRAARPDSPCNVYELINPLSGRNLDTTVVVGEPQSHTLLNKHKGKWIERSFDYSS